MAPRVGVFVDVENLSMPLGPVLTQLSTRWRQPFAEADVRRAYGGWSDSRMTRAREEVTRIGFSPVQVAGAGVGVANASDVHLAVDLVIESHEPGLDVVLLLSGDTGYLSAVSYVRSLGAFVFGAALEQKTSLALAHACDEFEGLSPRPRDEAPPDTEPLRAPTSTFEKLVFAALSKLLREGSRVSYVDLLRQLRADAGTDDLASLHGESSHLSAVATALSGTAWQVWHLAEIGAQYMVSERSQVPDEATLYVIERKIELPGFRSGHPVGVDDRDTDMNNVEDLIDEILDAGTYRRSVVAVE